jgi:uncharacterized membrane protein YcaP (DUF421 family)
MPETLLIAFRSLFSFFVLLFMARLMGKKQVSHLTFFDYIVGITIGSIAATVAVSTDTEIINGLIGLIIWSILPILMGIISQRSYWFRQIAEGHPTTIIENGKILEENVRKEKLTTEDLMILLREKNAFKLQDVEFAVLETNGKLSVMKKSHSQPIKPKNLGLVVEEEHNPRVVIIDGHIMERSLEDYGYTREWLLGEIMKQGASDFTDVFLAQVDSKGNVYADLYFDKAKLPPMKQRPLVGASLKKVQADLETFALQTENPEAKTLFQDQSKKLQKLIDEVSPYLKE